MRTVCADIVILAIFPRQGDVFGLSKADAHSERWLRRRRTTGEPQWNVRGHPGAIEQRSMLPCAGLAKFPDPSKCMREDAEPMLPGLQNSACYLRHEDAKRQIRKDRAMLFPHAADVACAVRRRPDHRLTEDSNTFPGQTVACGGQLAAGHWVAVVIMAAFLRIPRMCASGADDQLSHSQQTIKILHFDPSVVTI